MIDSNIGGNFMICHMCFEAKAQEGKTVCKECEIAMKDGEDINDNEILRYLLFWDECDKQEDVNTKERRHNYL